jgi:nucleotide-binding universal stress UspA family protein
MKILVAVDDSVCSQAAVDFVRRMAWPPGTQMIVMSAASTQQMVFAFGEYPDAPQLPSLELVEQQRRHHEAIAKRYARQLRESCQAVRAEVATADPREAIVDLAKREGVDLVILGSHGLSGLKKLLLGSVSSHVVAHAPCSVLVVKAPALT